MEAVANLGCMPSELFLFVGELEMFEIGLSYEGLKERRNNRRAMMIENEYTVAGS